MFGVGRLGVAVFRLTENVRKILFGQLLVFGAGVEVGAGSSSFDRKRQKIFRSKLLVFGMSGDVGVATLRLTENVRKQYFF